MRRGLIVGGLAQVLLADQHSGGLRSAQALAAGVADERCARGDVDVGIQIGSSAAASTKTGTPFSLAMAQILAMLSGPSCCRGARQDIDHRGAMARSLNAAHRAESTSTTSAPAMRTPTS